MSARLLIRSAFRATTTFRAAMAPTMSRTMAAGGELGVQIKKRDVWVTRIVLVQGRKHRGRRKGYSLLYQIGPFYYYTI